MGHGGLQEYGVSQESLRYKLNYYSDIATPVPVACAGDEWLCESKEHCVHKSLICDGKPHCNDESDEWYCDGGNYH